MACLCSIMPGTSEGKTKWLGAGWLESWAQLSLWTQYPHVDPPNSLSFSQHGSGIQRGRIQRANIPRGWEWSCKASFDLTSELVLCHLLYLGARHRGQPRFKEGELGSTSVWERSKVTQQVRKIGSQHFWNHNWHRVTETVVRAVGPGIFSAGNYWTSGLNTKRGIISWNERARGRASPELFSCSVMFIKAPSAYYLSTLLPLAHPKRLSPWL